MNQIQIMRDDPVLIYDGEEIRITGLPSRRLFRLLILSDGKTVMKSQIARLNDTYESHVSSKVRDLKRQLGGCEEMIGNEHAAGYYFARSGWVVDADEFCNAIQALDATFGLKEEQAVDPVEAIADLKATEVILGQWDANPGAGIPRIWEDKFNRLRRKVEDRRLKARLCTRDHYQIRDAILELDRRVNADDADNLTWKFLLLAYDAIGNQVKVASTWAAINQFHNNRPPDLLNAVYSGIRNGQVNPFRSSIPLPAAFQADHKSPDTGQGAEQLSLLDLCKTLGITMASALRLEGSHLTPSACIRRTHSRLYFMGVLSSKWVTDAAVRSEFKKLLTRLDVEKGDVRFLIIDPDGDGYRRLSELRKGHVSTESVERLRQLVCEHKCFKVRMYSNLPAFRIIVIDNDVVSFSAYRLAADDYLKTERGWESPHVVLDPLASYPLAEAFQLLFLETWENAKPLEARDET